MLYQTENQHGGDVYGGGITLDFSANTNPLGTPPGVLEAVCRALPRLHRYPDPYCRRLVQAIAGHEQVPASYILCGNGAADLIYTYCAALRPRTAVELAPTFVEYGAGLAQVGCRVERYFLHQAQNFDLDERFLSFLEEKKPEVVFLCNPNNPTGRLIPLPLLEQILQYCAAQGARLFLDECFLDLTEDGVSAKSLLAAHPELPALLDGLHFHTLCEQDADALAVTLAAVEKKFADLLPRMQWLNFGGGHHITRPGYALATLENCILSVRQKYGVQVYLEPGEAWALNAGYLVTTVLDTLRNGDTSLAILDMSAACHTPDVIEMPYRPPLLDAGEAGEKAHTVRLGGPTCLAGDIIGDYSFDTPLAEGDKLIFGDMAIYTTCKNNTFNGMPLPPIWLLGADGNCRELVHFGYQDFKMRLGAQ